MRTRKHQFSFAAGELSPEMFGRADAAQYQTGVARARNFIVKPQGSVRTRPGFERVRRSNDQGSPSTLIPFLYSNDQAYMIELGAAGFRFHRDGDSLKWGTEIIVGDLGTNATVDVFNDLIITESEHGLADGDTVRATIGLGGTLPGGITSSADFRVIIVDSRRIKFCTVGGYPTPTPIGPGLGSGFMRIFRTSELPRVYVEAETLTSANINTGTGEITLATTHNFRPGDPLVLTTTGTAPIGIPEATTFYVFSAGAANFYLTATLGGTVIGSYVSGGTGTHTLSYQYAQGELAFVPVDGGTYAAGSVIYCTTASSSDELYPTSSVWSLQTGDGVLAVPAPYAADEVFAVGYDQSGDVMTLTHPNHPERELRRLDTLHWVLVDINFGSTLTAPGVATLADYGEIVIANTVVASVAPGGSRFQGVFQGVGVGDGLLCTSAGYLGLTFGQVYVVNATGGNYPSNAYFELRELNGTLITGALSIFPSRFAFTDLISDNNTYRVSAVDSEGGETLSAPTAELTNNLSNSGASNTLSWAAVPGAAKYRIYKKPSGSGLFGLVGETGETRFVDSDFPADLSNTAPIQDVKITNAGNYSRASARFEQRRCFGGSDLYPRDLFLSRNGTETDFTFRIPLLDDDRIAVRVYAREAHIIQHIVPVNDLLILTNLGEWRVFAVNSDAITPTTIAVRPQSFIGASSVRPQTVNSSVLYAAARGGHIREVGYAAARQSFVNGDISMRAAHLFDGYDITCSAFSKAPVPISWWTSTSGRLLGLTYVPEEEVGGWHWHDTDGVIESVGSIPDGIEDRVYVTVARNVNGATVRSLERMGRMSVRALTDTISVDASTRYSGAGSGTVAITGGSFVGDTVTVTASATTAFSIFDIGTLLNVTASDIRIEVTEFLSQNTLRGVLKTKLPVESRGTALSPWAVGRKSIRVPDLQGATVNVLRTNKSSGVASVESVTVVNNHVQLSDYATRADIGLGYNCDLQLMPLTVQIEAVGFGRAKAINHAWLRVFDAAGISVGPSEDMLRPVLALKDAGALLTGETRSIIASDWTEDAQLWIRQALPLPATIVSATVEVSLAE